MAVRTSVATELQSYRSIDTRGDFRVERFDVSSFASTCLVSCCNGSSSPMVPTYQHGKRSRAQSDELRDTPASAEGESQAQQQPAIPAATDNLKTAADVPHDDQPFPPDGKHDSSIAKVCCPPHGAKAVCGKRNSMEDAFAVQPGLLCVHNVEQLHQAPELLPTRIAEKYRECSSELSDSCVRSISSASSSSSSSSASSAASETFHFFGVYDGHGGSQAAKHCAERLHHHLCDTLAELLPTINSSSSEGSVPEAGSSPQYLPDMPSGMTDELLMCCEGEGDQPPAHPPVQHDNLEPSSSPHSPCSERTECFSKLFEDALKKAFIKTDEEFSTDECSALVGSTAVVALVGGCKYCVANCGDSRAVLYRGGKAMQLTDDHKPERQDEAERVEKAGGQVLFWNGHRVMGVLAMSRAIGDHMLRPYVIAEPEVTIVSRHVEDELLLLASDGLWDVMSNQEASSLASRCLRRAQERGASRKAAARIAASVLTRAAIDRGSKDNITVVIVDLQAQPTADEPPRQVLVLGSSSGTATTAPAAAAGSDKAEADDGAGAAAAAAVAPAVAAAAVELSQ